MKNAIKRLSLALTLCALLPSFAPRAEATVLTQRNDLPEKTAVHVDFSEFTGVPLFKRQNMFSPSHSYVGSYMAEFIRDVPTLEALRSESMRVDLFMGNGGVGGALGNGTPENLNYSWMQLDMTLRNFYKGGTLPYLVYFATPDGLSDKERAFSAYWKYPPSSYEGWREVCAAISEHYARQKWPLAAHEIWNEPDWGDTFYGGTWDEYLKIYEYGASGVRQGDPYAMVGGMSLAEFDKYYSNGNVNQFLDYVRENKLPLDFISYHCYVTNNYPAYTKLANISLSAYGDTFASTGLHLNEFHVALDSKVTATERCVGPMMDAILFTLQNPQITSVNWACFRVSSEDGIQMIDSRSGKRMAAYHLISFYNRMPVDRVAMTEKNGLKGLASIDGKRAGVIFYNRAYKARDYVLALDNLPFERADVTVYCIDENHSNYGRNGGSDEPEIVLSAQNVSTKDMCVEGELLANGMLYVEIMESGHTFAGSSVTTISDSDIVLQADTATVLRREYYFEDRGSTMFSEFDLGSFTAYAGMGDAHEGLSKGAVYLEHLPARLIARPSLTRELAQGGAVYLTAEYLDEEGGSVLTQRYRLGSHIRLADEDVRALPLDGIITLAVPEGFDGVLKLSWGLVDAGEDNTLKITLDKE